MEAVGVREAVEALVGLDLSVADHAEIARAGRAVARLQAFVDLAKVQINRRGRQLAEAGDTSSSHALIDEGRCTGNDAKATNGRDRVCSTLPEFEDALATGAVTGAHLDALHQRTKNLTDAERAELVELADALVADAVSQPAALFDRNVKALVDKIREIHRPGSDADELDRQRTASKVKRWTHHDTGMHHTLISLDPVRDASLWAVIDHHLARLRRDPANAERPFAELQVEAVLASVNAGEPAVRVPEIVAHVDVASLCHGRHSDTMCETIDGVTLPVATVQRLCCEAVIQAVLVNPDGTVDRLCAEQRTANRAQRRLLAADPGGAPARARPARLGRCRSGERRATGTMVPATCQRSSSRRSPVPSNSGSSCACVPRSAACWRCSPGGCLPARWSARPEPAPVRASPGWSMPPTRTSGS